MKARILNVSLFSVVLFVGGCFSHKTAPAVPITPEISRDDIELLDTVEGSSTTDSLLFGLIQTVDGDKLRLLGISFLGNSTAILAFIPE
jgi:hypothetical protein